MSRSTWVASCRGVVSLAGCLVVAAGMGVAADPEPGPTESLAAFLAGKEIALADRAALAHAGPWTDAKDRMLVRVMARLPAPDPLASRWRAAAEPVAPRGQAQAVVDRLVRVRGRATIVAPYELPAELARLAGRQGYDVVRLVDERGSVADVVVPKAAAGWTRWRAIDEPAEVVGLPLTCGAGPVPTASGGAAWPAAPADVLLAATSVAWRPDTMLGRLGVDYTLFDTIVDDRRLESADAAAFYDVLAAAARSRPAAIVRATGGGTDVLSLIDPARKWFAAHRGEPVVIDGVARRATRIAIDDPARRTAVGHDEYWEVEVFADTPTIEVNDRIQDRYPIVCCVATLPAGMPTGESISERVRVPGFGFKRYSYPLGTGRGGSPPTAGAAKGERISTALVVAPTVEWRRPPSPAGASAILFAAFGVILGLVAAVAAAGVWRRWRDDRRAARRRRDELPDRIQLPGD